MLILSTSNKPALVHLIKLEAVPETPEKLKETPFPGQAEATGGARCCGKARRDPTLCRNVATVLIFFFILP